MITKKGFTLIEIIISIVLLVSIGIISVISIKNVYKNIRISELKKIESKIYAAANVYLEMKKDVNNELTNNNNAVVIPLKVLQNEGYMDFGNLNINKQYVLSVLGSTDPKSKCIDTTIVGTWEKEDDTVIYLCTDINEELKNLPDRFNALLNENIVDRIIVLENEVDALKREIKILKAGLKLEEKVYKGPIVNNYVKYNNHSYRIIEITSDKSIILLSEELYSEDFKKENIFSYDGTGFDWPQSGYSGLGADITFPSSCSENSSMRIENGAARFYYDKDESFFTSAIASGWSLIYMSDISRTEDCSTGINKTHYASYKPHNYKLATWIPFTPRTFYESMQIRFYPLYKVHLKNCYILGEGSGTESNPYNLINECD